MSVPERMTLAMRMALAAERSASERVARGGVRTDSTVSASAMRSQVPARPGEHLTLMPGQLHFGGHAATLRTLLGSCLAVTLWHPERRLGGMCHFLLPSRQRKGDEPLDGRYGDEALEALVNMLRAARSAPAEFHAHLYGGADTMPEGGALKFNVGARNIEQGFDLVDRYGFQIQGVDVGEDVPRTVVLTLATGEVSMRRGDGAAPQHHLQASLARSKA
jgi:chemotaxis protein CheD